MAVPERDEEGLPLSGTVPLVDYILTHTIDSIEHDCYVI